MSADSRAPKDDPPNPLVRPATPPDGIRSTTRRIAPATPSRPTAESETFGRIHRIVTWLDTQKGAFSISRLISQTGVNLRSFKADTKDDARVVAKLWPVIDAMLTEEERQALMKALREG